jgi:hypothetical protein
MMKVDLLVLFGKIPQAKVGHSCKLQHRDLFRSMEYWIEMMGKCKYYMFMIVFPLMF